jgi:uncharacterized protein (TIGR00251 family)
LKDRLPEDNSSYLNLKVTPNAARSLVNGYKGGVLQLRIAAPPVKGKANRELVAVLSRALGVSKSAIKIVKGQTSRHKVVKIEGLSNKEINKRLAT